MVGNKQKTPAWTWTESFIGVGFVLILFLLGGLFTAFIMFIMWALFSWKFDGNLNFARAKGRTAIDKAMR